MREHMFVAYPAYVREKARSLRVEKHLSVDEIAARLALPKTTIYYWVRDLPLGRPRRENNHPGKLAVASKYRLMREAAYKQGAAEFAALASDVSFRDFVCLYIGEGSKRSRNVVALCNSDPTVVALASVWIRRLSRNRVGYSVQYHADQNLEELRRFWSELLGVTPDQIRLQRKTNSGRLGGRSWRSRYGVLTVRVGDTLLRARLQAWMDCLKEQWLDSPVTGA
jgi:AcrR family transcriptional regulator